MNSKRTCGDCTKCCEGWLSGNVLGNTMYPGKPCHFISINQGCTVYSQRPKDPCISFRCQWLDNPEIPEWFKPNQINAIVKYSYINEIPYISILEAGGVLQSRALSWFIQYALNKQLNFVWQVEGEFNWVGSAEFDLAMQSGPPINKLSHPEPKNLLPLVSVE